MDIVAPTRADLSRVFPFSALDDSVLEAVAGPPSLSALPAGHVLLHEGTDFAGVQVLCTGSVAALVLGPEGEDLVAMHAAPFVIGLAEAFTGATHVTSYRTLEPSTVFGVEAGAFLALLSQCSSFMVAALTQLGRQRQTLLQDLVMLRTLDGTGRLAVWALDEDARQGARGFFHSHLSTEEVASLLGYSYSHFVRKVCRSAEHALIMHGRRWTIRNRSALLAMAGRRR
jgi:CRP-like cAMP-binding protein